MTQQQEYTENAPAEVAVPSYEINNGIRVRSMPAPPNGGYPSLSAIELTDLGALAAAAGMERSAVTALMHDMQSMTMETSLRSTGRVLERVRTAQAARLNTLAQSVRTLPGAPSAVFASITGRGDLLRAGYVSREAVLTLIQAMIAGTPSA